MDDAKQRQNEKQFGRWIETSSKGRKYWLDVLGRSGGKARYVKEVNAEEVTVAFWQEIFNKEGTMIEIHEKFPVDKGHKEL